ncbi:MAG: DUF4236 domain-containing protein [Balneolia bacterium]|nr:DUF4236 domain-containing protein [Balneolia bacterium]
MSFFIRKSLSSGPVRFNFSKGGVGLSAGITGARIGLNKNGAYVAGGRHGLYYRERIGSKKKGRGKSAGKADAVELFADTGQTFTPVQSAAAEEKPEKPLDRQLKTYFNAGASVLAAVGILVFELWIIGIGIAVYVAGLITISSRKQSAKRSLQQTESVLESIPDSDSLAEAFYALLESDIPAPWKPKRDELIAEAAITLYMDSTPEFGVNDLRSVLEKTSLDEDTIITLKVRAFDELLDACLEDHTISDDEKQLLEAKIQELELPESSLEKQLQQIEKLSKLGKVLDDPGSEIECPVNLTRGETCYYQTPARLLKRKIMDTHQRNNVRYKTYGYETELEGELYLTNKQIYIAGENVRNIRLSHVLDIVCSLEDDTLHLSIKNRVNPIIIAVPDAVLMSARLNYFIDQQNAS